jgi:NADPH2:quinone reductase
MKAAYLVKNGKASKAFEIRELDIPGASDHEVLIKVEAFGLNFADVMARLGLYPDAPPKPGIIGYDVVGTVESVGSDVKGLNTGDRVTAMTRFGGYAEYVCTDYRGVARISESMDPVVATALTTQGGTAYFMAREMVNIFPGDHVLVHAAAGGVGSLLVQMAKDSGAIVYGTAGSSEKIEFLKQIGVDHPIPYRSVDFSDKIKEISGKRCLDVVFDPVGGSSVKKGLKLLNAGGRMVIFGASSMTSARNIFQKLRVFFGFGFYSPIALLSPSNSIIGVNMLRIADHKPETLARVLKGTVNLAETGVIKPRIGGYYPIDQLAQAHESLEKRKTMGKLAIHW